MYFLQPISCLKYFGYVFEKGRISLFPESLKKEELASQNSYFSMEWAGLAGGTQWQANLSDLDSHWQSHLPSLSYTLSPLLQAPAWSWSASLASCLFLWRLEVWGWDFIEVMCEFGSWMDPWADALDCIPVCYQGNTGIQDALSIGEVL